MQCTCIESALLLQMWRRRASLHFALCLLKYLIFTDPEERIHQPGFTGSGRDRRLLFLSYLLLPKWVRDLQTCLYALERLTFQGSPFSKNL